MSFAMMLLLVAQAAPTAEDTPAPTTEVEAVDPDAASGDPETGEASEDIVVEGSKPAEKKVICRKEKPLGSNIKKRVCRTVEQEMTDAKNARDFHGRARGALDAAASARLGGN